MTKRSTYITLKTYRKLLKKIREEYKAIGCSFVLYRRPILWSAVKSGYHRRYGTIYGRAFPSQMKACVTTRGKISRAEILGVIAHELRHLQHISQGIYQKYYQEDLSNCPIYTGFRAEQDCDKFALKWLKDNGIIINKEKFITSIYHDYILYKCFYGSLFQKIRS